MKYLLAIMMFVVPLIVYSGCSSEDAAPMSRTTQENLDETGEVMKDTIRIIIGERVFKATLEANDAATAFKAILPLTLDMSELNGNEKFFDFYSNLPANASNPRTINSGDLMLWGSKTLVLFYKTFTTSYSYTRLGKIEDPSGLLNALGSGNVRVVFESQK